MDIFIGYLIGWVRFTDPEPSLPKSNSKFEVLLVKIFGLKTVFYSVKIFARADSLELTILSGKI